jgi:iron complex outermembrane receptor protein
MRSIASRPPTPTPAALALAIGCALSVVAMGGLTLGAGPASAQPAAAARKAYDIPAGPLPATLNRFGREAGLLLSYPATLAEGLRSPGLGGSFSVAEAWPLLLSGTGLVAVEQAGGGWTLLRRAAPVAAGQAPADPMAALPLVRVRGAQDSEAGAGPVQGYAATRSATGTKTDTRLLETPQSIAVIGAEQIADQKATSVTEALAYTPGVILDPGYANSYDVFYSRGFRLQDGNGSVYRDGLKLGGSGWATGQQEPYGLERIELLKGAASVLYGAAAPGGVLNVVTKQPHREQVSELVAEAGNHGHRAVSADLGASLSPSLTGRLVLLARDADTVVDHIPNDARYAAPSLRWAPTADTSVTLLGHFTQRRTAYIWGLPVEGTLLPSPHGQLPRTRFVGEPDFDRQQTTQSSLGWLVTHRLAEGVQLQHGLRWIDSENHVRFTNLRGPSEADARVYNRRAFDEMETTRGLSTDTRLQADFSAGGLQHKLLAGLDHSRHRVGSVWELATLGPLNLFQPVYGATAPGTFAPLFNDQERQRRLGLYLQDQVKVGGVTALAGVRRDDVRSELNGESEKMSATTGRVGAVWEVAPGVAPFASWSQSFEPVGGTDNDGRRYKPTRGEQFELGARWQRGDLMATAVAFDLVQSNVLKSRPGLPKSVQTGEVRSRGVELEVKGPVTRGVQLIASYAYTDAKVTRSEDAAEIGQPSSYQPRHQAALWTRVDHVGINGLHAGAGLRHTGRTSDSGGTGAAVPAATTVDVLLGYNTGPWTLRLNINNIADKDTLLCSGGWCVYGDGRRATASLAYRW